MVESTKAHIFKNKIDHVLITGLYFIFYRIVVEYFHIHKVHQKN
ncbi:hypothetical protein PU02_1148 [Bartonella ancashensis]|uniref:Uncharacterized protein n=1 Tax=Bartonella ancashensis TaxID=1318743 RepID=A0A0M4M4A4_9HYPH|nr:hypothetical protein PU02_1148 [Bartonella ancashensis]